MANEGMLVLVGLGALLLLGNRKTPPPVQETVTGSSSGFGSGIPGMFPPEAPGPPAFDIAGYIDTIFSETATVPEQPPMQYFFYPSTVVTSSGVPAVVDTPPDLITDTTKVQIGGEGGRTIVQSSLDIIRSEQIAKQEFAAAANASIRTSPVGEQYFYAATVEANRIEEARQKAFADALIAKTRAEQAATRAEQEAAAKVMNESLPPTINYSGEDDEGLSFGSTAGQDITVSETTEFIDVDFTPDYSESFVISGGMDSPMVFASEDEQPAGVAVHEITAQYDIGF